MLDLNPFDIRRRFSNLSEFNKRLTHMLHSTTTVGARFKDFVILAADRRATAGYYVAHKRTKKIIKVTNYMVLTTAGYVADAQMLAEWLREQATYYEISTGKPMPIKTAASLLSLVLFSARAFPYIVQLLVGGYDSAPRLFNLDWFGTVTEERYVATGSGSPVALGVLEERYREDMSVKEAVEMVKNAILSSIRRDAFTGNGIDIVVVSRKGIEEYNIELSR